MDIVHTVDVSSGKPKVIYQCENPTLTLDLTEQVYVYTDPSTGSGINYTAKSRGLWGFNIDQHEFEVHFVEASSTREDLGFIIQVDCLKGHKDLVNYHFLVGDEAAVLENIDKIKKEFYQIEIYSNWDRCVNETKSAPA